MSSTNINFVTDPATKKAIKQVTDNEGRYLKDKMHDLIYDELSDHIDADDIENSDPELIKGAIRLREEQAESEREEEQRHLDAAEEHAEEATEIESDIQTLEEMLEEAVAAQNSYEDDLVGLIIKLTEGNLKGVALMQETACVERLAEDHDRDVETVLEDLKSDNRLPAERFTRPQSGRVSNSTDAENEDYSEIIAQNSK